MLRALKKPPRLELRVVLETFETRHAGGRNFKLAQHSEPFVGSLVGEAGAGKLVEGNHIVAARCDTVEAQIIANLRSADHGPETPPVPFGVSHHAQIAVFGFVRPPPRASHPRIAELADRRDEAMAEQMFG